jgi:excisionase family DNA binding protein
VIFDDRFYSVAELAEVTGYHRDSIYRAIESGTLVAAKTGRQVADRRSRDRCVAGHRARDNAKAAGAHRIGWTTERECLETRLP